MLQFELMKLIEKPLSVEDLVKIRNEFGDYVKVTVDVGKRDIGCRL